jgi:DNA-binding PadR family transcriptional regulator
MHPHGWNPGGHHGHGGHGGHGGFGGGFGRMMGMGSKVRRGDVQPAVIALLKEQDMHGYQIIQELTERSGGSWNPSPGSIYPILQMLEDQDMVTSERVGGKRVFSLTESGREYAETLPDEAPWAEMSFESDPTRRLRKAFGGLMAAAGQVGRSGSQAQMDKTADIIDEARKRVYELLAGDE